MLVEWGLVGGVVQAPIVYMLGEGVQLKQGYPIARDLRVGRMKPLETVVEVRSSADPQIACVTCA